MRRPPEPLAQVLWRSIGLAGVLLCGAIGLAAAADGEPPPTVILLSWDGLRHDYLDRGDYPGLARMQRSGWQARRLRPPWPSNTFPGHATLATGALPDVHGVVDNVYLDRQLGESRYSNDADWLLAEPLWAAAQRQGVNAATFFWVGSSTDWRGQGWRHRRAPFDARVGETAKVEQILSWLDLPAVDRPQLIMAWWHGADGPGHDHGPDHPAVAAAVADQDRHLQQLLAGLDARALWPNTTLIVVSDHGMTALGEVIDISAALRSADIGAHIYGRGSLQHVFLDEPGQVAGAVAVLRGVDTRLVVHDGAALPPEWRIAPPARRGDVVVSVPAPLTLGAQDTMEWLLQGLQRLLGRTTGGHGYDPADPDMGGVFLALGRGVRGDEPREVRAIDVAATVSALLGIDPPAQSEGQPVWPVR